MDFVVISTADWDHPLWTNKQHVASTLASMGHRVLYIESLGLRKPMLTRSDRLRIKKRFKRIFEGLRLVQDNIWVMSPFSIPGLNNSALRFINEKLLIKMIKISITKLGFSNIVLWTYNPTVSYLIKNLPYWKSVYHCVDDISEQPKMNKRWLQDEEKKLLNSVDMVFTTSLTLQKEKSQINKKCYYYPNVADYEHFHRACVESFNRPADLPPVGKPILGFIGAISKYKQDFQLLLFLAQQCHDCNIVLIGSGDEDLSKIFGSYNNIYLLGMKPYGDLPQYLSFFDVALLPCCINAYTDHMFPMKFFEYLAAGKPVVSTDLKTLQDFSSYCYLAHQYSDFVNAIRIALQASEKKKMGCELAAQYTYRSRMEWMLELLMKSK